MNLIDLIKEKLNDNKLKKLKKNFLKDFNKNKKIGNISNIQKYISKNNIALIESKGYGDKYDSIENIFSENNDIKMAILNERKSELYPFLKKLSYEDINEPLLSSNIYLNFKDKLFKYDSYYNLEDKKGYKSNFIKEFTQTQDNVEEDIKRVLKIIPKIDTAKYDEHMLKKIYKNLVNGFEEYSISKIDNEKYIYKKQEILKNISNLLDNMSNKYIKDSEQDYTSNNFKKKMLMELSKSDRETTKIFISRQESIEKLDNYKIDSEEGRISFIDASDETKNTKFYENLRDKKRNLMNKKFDVKDLMMVRTTEDFPYNKEFEVIDEDNSISKIKNSLTDKLFDKIIIQKYGKDYNDIISQDNGESKKIKKDMHDTYEKLKIISSAYRTTKHFTLNGLVSSHAYGNFENKSYIILEPFEEHINDPRLINFNEADTYFKISKEDPFKLSERATLMMPVNEYLKQKDDDTMKKQFEKFNITLFDGDEKIAVDKKLNEMGYISEEIGMWGFNLYDDFSKKLDDDISKIAKENNLRVGIHYDSKEKDEDYKIQEKNNSKVLDQFNEYLVGNLEENIQLKKDMLVNVDNNEYIENVIDKVGVNNLVKIIENFNEQKLLEFNKKRSEKHKEIEGNTKTDEKIINDELKNDIIANKKDEQKIR